MRLDLYAEGGYSGGGITENGGNISGPLLLAGNPSQTLEAVPKQYVDAYYNSISASNLTNGTLHAARLPNFTGDLQSSPGTTQLTLNNSGVTAGEYSKVTVNAKGIVTAGSNISDSDIPFGLNWSKINPGTLPSTLSGYGITNGVSVNGGTMLGFLSISNEPTLGSHIATKQYVDALVSGGGIAVGDILRKPYSTTPIGFLKCNGAEVDKTTYADLYSVLGDQYKENTFAGSGKPWSQQYDVNQLQSGDITGWTAETGLPYYLAYSNTVITKNRVYVIGGHTNTTPTNAVYYAPINADGSLGTWTAGTGLPAATFHNEVIVVKNKLYIFGGNNASNTATLSTVYSTNINSDGSLGAWNVETSLPYASRAMVAFATKTRVYLVGGINGSTYLNTVIYATINSDGSLGAWMYDSPLPFAYGQGEVAVVKNKVYIVGGYNGTNVINTVYSATINNDGSISSFSLVGTLPGKLGLSQIYVSKNTLYIFGGHNDTTFVSTCYYCNINNDGTLGTWFTGTSLALATANATIAAGKNRLYIIAGFNGGYLANVYSAPINGGLNDYSNYYAYDNVTNYIYPGSGQPWRQQYQINATQSADITGWTTGVSLPDILQLSTAIVTKNRVYLCGGYNTVATANVYTAPINTDGTLGAWTAAIALPTALRGSQAVVTKNRVYLCGGHSTSAVYSAAINSDGTLGTWNTETSLPAGCTEGDLFITRNRVYLCGGSNGSVAVNTVYTAIINSDGTIGTWTTAPALPSPLYGHQTVVTKNRVYLLGGYNGTAYVSTIYMATINSNGGLSTWATVGNLPATLYRTQVIVTANYVYLIGGQTNTNNSVSSIYKAPINSDGTLGAWVAGTSLPGGLYQSQAIITKNRIYLLGGNVGATVVSTVYTAPLSEGLNDYSPYYDGSISVTDAVNYMIPGSGRPWEQQYQINTTQSTDITGWTTSTALPGPLYGYSAIVTKNRVYLCGGSNGVSAQSVVYTATINTDGTLSAWTTGTALPVGIAYAGTIVTKNRVYLLGGWNSSAAVYTAPINTDGTLGTWAAGTSLPVGVHASSAIVTKNRVYLIAGYATSSIYTALINDDGTLGVWNLISYLPSALHGCSVFITKNRIYVVGGATTTTAQSTVYTAEIDTDGNIGNWISTTSFPVNIYNASVFVTKNKVYIIAGSPTNSSAVTTSVYSAPINVDGIVGTWSLGTSVPSGFCNATLIVVKNKVYTFGGFNGASALTTVYTANISSDIQDYTYYYDGSFIPISTPIENSKFILPDLSADEAFGSYSYIKY